MIHDFLQITSIIEMHKWRQNCILNSQIYPKKNFEWKKKAVVEWFPENDPHKAEWPLLSLWSFPPNTIHWQRGQKVSVLVESDVRKTSQRICSDKKNYITWDFRQNCNSHINVLCYIIFLVFWFDTIIAIFFKYNSSTSTTQQ